MGVLDHILGRLLGASWLVFALLAQEGVAATVYRVHLNTAEFVGTSRHLVLDWVSPGAPLNTATVGAFLTNGTRSLAITQGGPVSGGLVDGGEPLSATMRDSSFYNQLVIPLDSAGTYAAFDVGTSENVGAGEAIPEQLAFFFLDPDETFPFPTVDPLGANALFAIDVTGQSGGDLGVFAPMVFVPPDTLRMSHSTTAVVSGEEAQGRLKFRSTAPNPSLGGVALVYEVPEPGGLLRVRVFDVAGRLVAEPFFGRRAAGTWTTHWDGMGSRGRVAPTGMYIVQLQMGGQSLVRRIVLTR